MREELASYDATLRESFIWRDLREVRNMRQAFGHGFWLGGALAGAMTATKGRFPRGNRRTERDAEQPLIRTRRSRRYPAPDGKLAFDKLSSVFASGNKTRDDQPNHIRVQTRVAFEVGRLWEQMCPAQVYEWADGAVQVTPSNCVQCGAISAKGGRLTPPEGGAGPEYKLS
jgi:electron-transferring-flavoprotein dehydrogenase